VYDVIGDELCLAFGQPRVTITVEHEDRPAVLLGTIADTAATARVVAVGAMIWPRGGARVW
jgi:hypothetical protein